MASTALPLGKQTITLSFLGNTSFLASNTIVNVTIVASVFVLNGTASGALTLSNTSSITDDGTNKSVTLPPTNSPQFFRLRRP